MARALGRAIDDEWLDGVTALAFGASSVLVTSWDGTARTYDARESSTTRATRVTLPSPVMCGTFVGADDGAHVVGTLDGGVTVIDGKTGDARRVGAHDGAVTSAAYDDAARVLVTCGWDRKIKCWDLTKDANGRCVSETETVGKCYAGDLRNGRLVAATSDGQILAYDVKDLLRGGRPKVNRRSSVRFQTRAIACDASASWFVNATVEGRVAVERVDDEENEKSRFAFKCHRLKNEDGSAGEVIYPVHALSFHPLGTFATGGGDGYVNYWDADARKRLFSTPRYPTSVSALAFSPCGTMLAVASSFAHEERENATPIDRVYIREVNADEVTPRKPAR